MHKIQSARAFSFVSWACLALSGCSTPGRVTGPAMGLAEGTAVSVDGRLTPEEWADADRILTEHGVEIHSKRTATAWLLGIRLPYETRRYVDVYTRDAQGKIRNFHASLQQGERMIDHEWTDESPAYRWGKAARWQTSLAPRNIIRPGESSSLEGYEMEIAIDQLGRCPFVVMIEIRDFFGAEPDWVFPSGSSRSNPTSWATLSTPC